MTELDFEELDRAVSSLMEKGGNAQASSDGAPSAPATPRDSPSTGFGATDQLAGQSSPTVVRQTGRFMDVVRPHPGKFSAVRPMPSKRVPREGVDLQPNPQPEALNRDDQSIAETAPDISPVIETKVDEATSDAVLQQEAEIEAQLDDLVDDLAEETDTTPMQSPFLNNVEVEKRPLGATLSDEPVSTDSLVSSDTQETVDLSDLSTTSELDADTNEQFSSAEESTDDSNQQTTDITTSDGDGELADTGESTALEIGELDQTDAWASETKQDISGQPVTVTLPEFSDEVMALERTTPIADLTTDGVKLESEPVQSKPVGLVNPGDIPRQYTPEVTDQPEPVGVFDAVATDTPQPVKHPEKKKSGWMVVVWIFLLIILGVIGGVLAWFFLLK